MENNLEFSCHAASTNFIDIRTKNGLTQEELANILGVAPQTVKNYEKAGSENVKNAQGGARANAIAGMKIETLFKMAKYFNVSADYLLGISNIPCTTPDMRSAMEYTGLSQTAIETIKELQGPFRSVVGIDILNWLLSNRKFTLGLIARLHNYEMECQRYFAVSNSYERESAVHIAPEGKTITPETCHPLDAMSSLTSLLMDIGEAEDNKDLALFRVNKQFGAITDELIDFFCDKTAFLGNIDNEEIL